MGEVTLEELNKAVKKVVTTVTLMSINQLEAATKAGSDDELYEFAQKELELMQSLRRGTRELCDVMLRLQDSVPPDDKGIATVSELLRRG